MNTALLILYLAGIGAAIYKVFKPHRKPQQAPSEPLEILAVRQRRKEAHRLTKEQNQLLREENELLRRRLIRLREQEDMI